VNFTTRHESDAGGPVAIRHGQLLGSRLRGLRKRNGITLEQLAARCSQLDPAQSPSISYLSMLETGKRTPSPVVLSIIAQVFGREPAWFLDASAELQTDATAVAPDEVTSAFEPAFLFTPELLRAALPELLFQTGTSGRSFAQLLIRVWQETHQNDFPEIERAAETAGERVMPLSVDALLAICKRYGLSIRWIDDDRRRLNRGLARAHFETPDTIVVSARLRKHEARLKYELAFFLGHKILHLGDGAIGASGADREPDAAGSAASTPGLAQRDALIAWREFECSSFAGALLCPRTPFRQMLVRERHAIDIYRALGVGPAVVMRRMTAVSTYRHWHFFDAYPPGILRTVYRGNGISLPWGNLSVVPDPCPHWAVFRLLRERTAATAVKDPPTSQLSVMQASGVPRLYACHSLMTRDAAGAERVLSVGIDIGPALAAQGYDAQEIIDQIWQLCQRGSGATTIPAASAARIQNVAHVLRIGWVAAALENKARIICSRSAACPRDQCCGLDGR